MKKVLMLIFTIFLLFSCWETTQKEDNKEEKIEIQKEESRKDDFIAEIKAIPLEKTTLDKAYSHLDFNECFSFEDEKEINSCIIKVVEKRISFWINDISYCDTVKELKYDLYYKDNFNRNLDLKETCYDSYYKIQATENLDLDFCSKIKDKVVQSECVNRNFEKIIEQSDNLEVCLPIEDISQKNNCLNRLASKLAIDGKDQKICNELLDNEAREYCYVEYIESIRDTNTDITICKKLNNEDFRNNCIMGVNINLSKESTDMKVCDNFADDNMKNNCIFEIALKNAENWIDKCNYLDKKDENLLEICESKLAIWKWIKFKNLSACDGYENIEKQICETEITNALNKKVWSDQYCDLYKDEELKKEECKRSFDMLQNHEKQVLIQEANKWKVFCDSLLFDKRGRKIDKKLCYELVWVK